ncbi:MAG: coenzyme F420-0:L-glutamate ligase [bacterium]
MKITTIRTGKIVPGMQTLENVLDSNIPPLKEGSVVAVTSKIISICEGRVVPVESAGGSGKTGGSDKTNKADKMNKTDKAELVKREADFILYPKKQRYNIILTLKRNVLIPTAGIDESNGNGYYVLWPADPQKSANEIRAYLRKRFHIKDIGVIVTDSHTSPFRRGTTGVAIAYSGFQALRNYVGKPDIFGRTMKVTKANVADALAVAAVLVMGEGSEQTPLAIIEEVPFVGFQRRNPSAGELRGLYISIESDLYGPLLTSVKWHKGGGRAIK